MYATLVDLKSMLGISAGTDDVLLTQTLTRAQGAIDRYCRRTFEAAADSTRTFEADDDVDGRRLWLDADLCAVTTITNGDGVVISSTHYLTDPRHGTPYYGLTLRATSAYAWTGTISIAGKWAYSVSAPDDITQATLMLASFYHNRRGTEGYSAVEVSNAVSSTLDLAAMPAAILALLAPYRRLV